MGSLRVAASGVEVLELHAAKPTVATQGTVRAIWESLEKPYRAALEQGLSYTRIGNPIGMAEVSREKTSATEVRVR